MAKYKTVIKAVKPGQLEKDTPKLKIGDWFITVAFTVTHEEQYGQWVELAESKEVFNRYYLGDNMIGKEENQRTMSAATRESFKKQFNYEMGDDLQELIGFENVVVTEVVNGYENIKFVNNPSFKKAVFASEESKTSFAEAFSL